MGYKYGCCAVELTASGCRAFARGETESNPVHAVCDFCEFRKKLE